MSNSSIITDFLLLGFSEKRELQMLHIVAFLVMYLTVLLGNGLIIALVAINTHLHTPMYFFLVNLSIVDLGTISTTVPKSITNVIMNTTQISYMECAAQVLCFIFISSDLFLLTAMAYDRYVAICQPLHYPSVMKLGTCIQMACGAWIVGLFNAAVHTGTMFSTPFCGNIINQFFCELPQLLKLSCSDSFLREFWALLVSAILGLCCFVCIVMSYVQIFTTVLKMPSLENRQKAFSTCIPHLMVVSLLVITGVFAYLMPTSSSSFNLDEVLTVLYSVVPPMMNPIIYSMRNKHVKTAMWKMFYWELPTKNTHIRL